MTLVAPPHLPGLSSPPGMPPPQAPLCHFSAIEMQMVPIVAEPGSSQNWILPQPRPNFWPLKTFEREVVPRAGLRPPPASSRSPTPGDQGSGRAPRFQEAQGWSGLAEGRGPRGGEGCGGIGGGGALRGGASGPGAELAAALSLTSALAAGGSTGVRGAGAAQRGDEPGRGAGAEWPREPSSAQKPGRRGQ